MTESPYLSRSQQTFGVHLWFTIFVIFCASLTWGYVNYVRPRMQKEENDGDEALLDENDVTANLVSVSGSGCGNKIATFHKLSIRYGRE